MMYRLILCLSGLAITLSYSSRITAAVAAASGAGALGTGAAGAGSALTLGSLLGSAGAPESIENRSLVFCSAVGEAGQNSYTMAGSSGTYTRVNDKMAVFAVTGEEGTETYHLTFTGKDEGSFSFESRAADGSVSTAHGTFKLQ